MILINKSWGYNDRFGLEVSVLDYDPIDYETHNWDHISIKFLFKVLVPIYVFGIEVGPDRASIGVLNCFVTVFYRY